MERDFRASLDAVLPWRTRVAALTCLAGSGLFALLDAAVLRASIVPFRVAVRAGFLPAYVLVAWLASTRAARARPHLPVLLLAASLAVELGVLGARLAPAESVGFFPAILFFTVFLPLPRREGIAMAALFTLGFAVPHLWLGSSPLAAVIRHVGNVLATGAIGLVAGHMAEALGRREFVAQRRLAQTGARLEALARAKDRFFGEVSTELRTPLTAALLALETSRLGEGERAPVARPLQRLQKLVDELLALSRVDAGAALGQVADLAGAARRLTDEFGGAFAFRGLELQVELPGGPLPVRMGAESLGRVIANLLGRALERVPRGGRVVLRAAARRPEVVLEVCDDGPAITPTDLPRVFDRFAPLEGADVDGLGSGIALSVARGLVELHQGRLEVLSAPGAGTTFRASLPLAEAAAGPGAPETLRAQALGAVAAALDGSEVLQPAPLLDAPPQGAPLALVVEDHQDLAARLEAAIGRAARVLPAATPEEALAKAREAHPDLVVCEALFRGGASGLELARRLRDEPSTRATPILVLSALTGREHVLAALLAGADDVLAKPFDGAMLRARVEGLLRLKRRRDEAQEARGLLRALCDGFAQALGWEGVLLLAPAQDGALAQLACGGAEPPPGKWGERDSPWAVGSARPLVLDGRAVEPGPAALAGLQAAAVAPLDARLHAGALVGHSRARRPVDARDLDGLRAAAASVGALLARERRADALAQVAEDRRRLSSAVVSGQDAERRRFALEIHDGAGQVLVGALLHLDLAGKTAPSEPLQAARLLVLQALAEIRSVAHDLHPPGLAQHGLQESLRQLAEQLSGERPKVQLEVGPGVPAALPPALALNLYRIAQAALGNAVRHANARTIAVRVQAADDELVLEVEDDGDGFLPALARHGVGLLGMRERAAGLGGRLTLDADLGRGTRVRCAVPLPALPAA